MASALLFSFSSFRSSFVAPRIVPCPTFTPRPNFLRRHSCLSQPSLRFFSSLSPRARVKPLPTLKCSLFFNTRAFYSSSRQSFRAHPKPPSQQSRPVFSFLDNIPLNVIFYGIIGTNVVVFAMWHMASQKAKLNNDASSLIWMYQNFTNSWRNISSGRLWTVLTSCFSHMDPLHIFTNLFTFAFMAYPVLETLRPRRFLLLYFGGGLMSSAASMIYTALAVQQDRQSLGASGAIYSVLAFLACLSPNATFQLYGIIPIPAWLVVSGLFVFDTYRSISGKQGTTDTVGHIGGLLAGVGYFLALRFRIL